MRVSRPDPLQSRCAPAVAAILLLAMGCVTLATNRRPPEVRGYFESVAAAIDTLPAQIDGALGVNVGVTPGAVKILKPNRLLQRRYQDPADGTSFDLLVVHCGEVRDMNGHYPPVCYPAHGWVQEGHEDVQLEVAGRELNPRIYTFTRGEGQTRRSIHVLNLLAVPEHEGVLAGNARVLDTASRSRLASRLGAGQLQIITSASMPAERRQEIWRTALTEVMPVLDRIVRGESHES